MMNVKSFVERAKKQGIKMLVFQTFPKRQLWNTGTHEEIPDALGQSLAWASLELAKLTGHDPKDVLQSLYAHSMGVANKVIEEELKKSKDVEMSLEDIAKQAGEDDEDEDLEDQDDLTTQGRA